MRCCAALCGAVCCTVPTARRTEATGCCCRLDTDTNSLLRSDILEIVNLVVASVCILALLATAVWHTGRVRAARARGAVWALRRRFALGMSRIEMGLVLANLVIYVVANAYSIAVGGDLKRLLGWSASARPTTSVAGAPKLTPLSPHPPTPQVECGWFDVPIDICGLLAMSIWSTLFILNIVRPLFLLPPGAWYRLRQRCHASWAKRGCGGCWRCLAACCGGCCCCCSCCVAPAGGSDDNGGSGDGEGSGDPEQSQSPGAKQKKRRPARRRRWSNPPSWNLFSFMEAATPLGKRAHVNECSRVGRHQCKGHVVELCCAV